MSIAVMKIKKTGTSTWKTLPTPMGLKPGINIIDSSKSGRDNNKGTMFRDIVTGKNKYTATMPSGLNNTQYAEIADIILADSFDCWHKDILLLDARSRYRADIQRDSLDL